ncbi:MAG: hypothetical protein KBA31_00180 [Alphaproteobacteria bacterium]|nr:hypothetical protein [Alphaproteobacteria bacterium]
MSAGKQFAIEVTAKDMVTPVIGKVDKALSRLEGGALKRTNTALGDVANASRLSGVEKGFRSIGDSVIGIGDALLGLMPGLGALTAAGAGAGIVNLGVQFASTGAEIDRSARLFDIGTDKLQELRGAMTLAGGAASDFDNAWVGLSDALEGAKFGRNIQAVMMLSKIGLRAPGRNEAIDQEKYLAGIARALPRYNAASQRIIASALGVTSALPLLNQGPDRVAALRVQARKSNVVMSGADIASGKASQSSLSRLGLAAKGAANKIGSAIPLGTAADAISSLLEFIGGDSEKFSALANGTAPKVSNRPVVPKPMIPRIRSGPVSPGADAAKPWYEQRRLIDTPADELRAIGRSNPIAISDSTSTVRIILEGAPRGTKVLTDSARGSRVIVQQKHFMEGDSP